MTVKDTVIDCLRRYPALNKNKVDVFDHLFLTVGNGYEWVNGELVYWKEEERYVMNVETAIQKCLFNEHTEFITMHTIKAKLNDFMYDCLEEENENVLCLSIDDTAQKILDRLNRTKATNMEYISRILRSEEEYHKQLWMHNESDLYDLSGYSKVCNIPVDIKDDWKEAIVEFYNFIMNDSHLKVIAYRKMYGERLTEVLKDRNIIK